MRRTIVENREKIFVFLVLTSLLLRLGFSKLPYANDDFFGRFTVIVGSVFLSCSIAHFTNFRLKTFQVRDRKGQKK